MHFFKKNDVRNIKQISTLSLCLVTVFILIMLWRDTVLSQKPVVKNLPEPPSVTALPFIKASDASFVYRIILFWLQQFDVQSGQYVSYRHLDYQRVISWLDLLIQLEPESQYPMLMATRIYTRVADHNRIRMMLDYTFRRFKINPGKNWKWLAEATVTARHTLHDPELALKYATELAEASSKEIPHWARDMRLIILEDMGEVEQVKLLIGGLMSTNAITDANELRFLELLLSRLQKNNK